MADPSPNPPNPPPTFLPADRYYLHTGTAEVVISGAYDRSSARNLDGGEEEQQTVQGHTVRILQQPGWAFGDLALLFNSPRTASVVAQSDVAVYCLDRRTFLQVVIKHAEARRRCRCLHPAASRAAPSAF